MFLDFFYKLKNAGVYVTPKALISLHRAILSDLVHNLKDFYITSRCILIKNERYFDIFDQVFAHHFHGAELPDIKGIQLDKIATMMLEEWLKNPESIASAINIDSSILSKMTPDQLIEYFKNRLKEQTESHRGGKKWIGTQGTSPVGHSGNHAGGMRVAGKSINKSAVKIALERRYKNYSLEGPLNKNMIGEALKKLKNLIPCGAKDQVNIDKSIYLTIKNAGEIEIFFDQKIKNKLKIILLMDNGGWSMDPYTSLVSTLFSHSKSQFNNIETYFFHNTIYETIWKDSERYKNPINIQELANKDYNTRLIVVGDASMAPYEIMAKNGSIYSETNNSVSSINCLKFLAKTFYYSAWLNPVPSNAWEYTRTISIIKQIFPMFELSIDGLQKAISHLVSK